ncbi:hypothetical protein [Capillimicrobium parvum]|uniref:DMT family transporter n=1 Tax=Capillimicrobium parvum TaxID=2884022 RepID=A0A9E7C279_9ACTN|nr:hypothetical protein [Capillimicrobium parvum]UGS38280.1 hypothetical protein DSM104329_04704 [Capillimicrobium parvum]
MTLHFGILFALLCAFATNLAFLYKHRGAAVAAKVDVRHPVASAVALFRSPWFAIGMLVAFGAWVFHVAALAMAPMSVVQVVLAGGLVLLAVMADRMFGFHLGLRQWLGLGAMAVGLALIAITQPAMHGSHSSYSLDAITAFEGGLLALGGLLIAGPRVMGAREEHHGLALGAAAGVLFGVSDVAIKAITGVVGMDGLFGIVTPWTLVAVIASIAAFYASARGLQDGEAVPVIAITGTAANVSCIAGGIIVFGDPMPGTAIGIAIQAFAFVLVVLAAALTPAPVRAARVAPAAA